MNQADLLKRVDRMNKRVTHEWDEFMGQHGIYWDDLSDEAKQKACELAEMIADRWAKQTYE